MRKLLQPYFLRSPSHTPRPTFISFLCPTCYRTASTPQCRALAQVHAHRDLFPEICFTSSSPCHYAPPRETGIPRPDVSPVDERTLKLGKTLETLQARLPSLLASPLPPEILSPHITLHLFPSTHPHLPTVSGRVAYHAALWTAPVAWGRVPIVGNVKLIILSERMVKNGPPTTKSNAACNERLIVRWKTCGKTKGKGMRAFYKGIGAREQVDKITEWLGGDVKDDEEFGGLFIFEFDEEGRIVTHTIEHAEEGGSWDRASKVVSVTDWLLGKAKRKQDKDVPAFVLEYCPIEQSRKIQARR